MNFLAHFHVTPPMADALVGAYLGDFVRGRIEEHTDLPPLMRQGITLHRKVDGFTDTHPIWRTSAARLEHPNRRLAGVIIDVIYDHYLCLHWERFAKASLPEFAEFCYASLLSRTQWMETDARRGVRRMKEQDWINTYARVEGIDLAFERMSRRSPLLKTLPAASADFRQNYEALEADFLRYYPELLRFARETWRELTAPDGTPPMS